MAPKATPRLTLIAPALSPDTAPQHPDAAPLKQALAAMVGDLVRLHVPVIPVFPEPRDFDATAEHLLSVADIIDRYVAAVGAHVAANASNVVDLRPFTSPLRDALEGNATHEIDTVVEIMREEVLDAMR